jgi:hypothetical protein
MVTSVQPFGVFILISISGQRWSEMLGSSTHSPMFAMSITTVRVRLTFYVGCLSEAASSEFCAQARRGERGAASSSVTHHPRGHGPSAQPTLHGRLAQDTTFGELESAAVR